MKDVGEMAGIFLQKNSSHLPNILHRDRKGMELASCVLDRERFDYIL